MRGRASPHGRRGPTPFDTLGSSPPVAWSFSRARLNAVGAGPAARRGRAEPACTTWSEKTQARAPGTAPGVAVLPGAELRHARSQIPGAVSCRTLGRRAPAAARTPLHKPFAMAPETLWHLLTNFFLRWCQRTLGTSWPSSWAHAFIPRGSLAQHSESYSRTRLTCRNEGVTDTHIYAPNGIITHGWLTLLAITAQPFPSFW